VNAAKEVTPPTCEEKSEKNIKQAEKEEKKLQHQRKRGPKRSDVQGRTGTWSPKEQRRTPGRLPKGGEEKKVPTVSNKNPTTGKTKTAVGKAARRMRRRQLERPGKKEAG